MSFRAVGNLRPDVLTITPSPRRDYHPEPRHFLLLTSYCYWQYHAKMWKVYWSKSVDKDLDRLPEFILQKFRAWVVAVERDGMLAVRRLKGFHDEPLRGNRVGQRSVRLNVAYRVVYVERADGAVRVAQVIEVNKHAYR